MTAFQAGLILMRIEHYERASDLTGTDVLVLTTLFSFAADVRDPSAFPSAAKVAKRSLLSRRTVQRSLDKMEVVGVITGAHRHRRATVWALDPFLTNGDTESPPEPVGTTPNSVKQSPPGVTATPVKRQRVTQQASESRTAGVRKSHQSTEVGYGPKVRNRTDVGADPSGSSGGTAALAPSSPPGGPKPRTTTTRKPAKQARPPKVEVPRCPHGLVGGLKVVVPGNMRRRFRCDQCVAVAPDPGYGYPEWSRWLKKYPTLDIEIHCADPDRDEVAQAVGRAVLLENYGPDSQQVHGLDSTYARQLVAYTVDHLEPGRVDEVLASQSCETDVTRLGLGHLAGRCPDCEMHVEKQGHAATCGRSEVAS